MLLEVWRFGRRANAPVAYQKREPVFSKDKPLAQMGKDVPADCLLKATCYQTALRAWL